MPVISRFLGITIAMFFDEQRHALPHFHAEYHGYEISVNIINGEILAGKFPRPALRRVMDWYIIHKDELIENWERARNGLPLHKIAALE